MMIIEPRQMGNAVDRMMIIGKSRYGCACDQGRRKKMICRPRKTDVGPRKKILCTGENDIV